MVKVIEINGVIVSDDYKEVYEHMEIENISSSDFINQLPKNGKDAIEIHVNSPGGHMDAGVYMYTKLKEYQGKVTVKVLSLAGSITSVIIMAADEILISPAAQIMIHNAWGTQTGNQHKMREAAAQLEELAESLVNAYELRTGQSREKIKQWMDEETYFSAHKAVEYGFADEVMYSSSRTQSCVVAACVDANGLLAQSVIDEYFAKKKEQPPQANNAKRKLFLF